MYGEVAWSGPAPLAVPSVVEEVPLPGWRTRQRYAIAMTTVGAHRGFRAITRPVWALLHDGGG